MTGHSKKVSRRLNPDVMGGGQSHGTGHLKKVSRGLNHDVMGSGQSHGTGHFDFVEVASPMGLAIQKRCQEG